MRLKLKTLKYTDDDIDGNVLIIIVMTIIIGHRQIYFRGRLKFIIIILLYSQNLPLAYKLFIHKRSRLFTALALARFYVA